MTKPHQADRLAPHRHRGTPPDTCARCGGVEPYEVDAGTAPGTMVCACYDDVNLSPLPLDRWKAIAR